MGVEFHQGRCPWHDGVSNVPFIFIFLTNPDPSVYLRSWKYISRSFPPRKTHQNHCGIFTCRSHFGLFGGSCSPKYQHKTIASPGCAQQTLFMRHFGTYMHLKGTSTTCPDTCAWGNKCSLLNSECVLLKARSCRLTLFVAIRKAGVFVHPERNSRGHRAEPRPLVHALNGRFGRRRDVFVPHPEVAAETRRD